MIIILPTIIVTAINNLNHNKKVIKPALIKTTVNIELKDQKMNFMNPPKLKQK